MAVFSIMWSLTRWIDLQTRDRQQEIRRMQEQQEGEADGDDPPETYVLERPERQGKKHVEFRCRICGHTADHKRFCLVCLADTLVKVV